MKIFADCLRDLITSSGLSQRQFALSYNFSKNQVHYWVSDKAEPDYSTLVYLCKIFSVSADYLLGLTDDY